MVHLTARELLLTVSFPFILYKMVGSNKLKDSNKLTNISIFGHSSRGVKLVTPCHLNKYLVVQHYIKVALQLSTQ